MRGARAARRRRRQLPDAAAPGPLPALVRRRPRSGAPKRRAGASSLAVRLSLSPTRSPPHERYPPHHPVGDVWFLAGVAVGRSGRSTTATSRPSARPAKPAGHRRPRGARQRRRRAGVAGAAPRRQRRAGRRAGRGRRAATSDAAPRVRGEQRHASPPTCCSADVRHRRRLGRCAPSCSKHAGAARPSKHVVLLDQNAASARTWRRAGPDRAATASRTTRRLMTRAARRARAGRRRRTSCSCVRVARVGRRQVRQDLHLQARRLRRSACKHEVVNVGAAPVDAAAVPAAGARRQRAAGRSSVLLHLHRPGHLHRGQEVPEGRLQATSTRARPTVDNDQPTTAGSRWCSTTSPSAWHRCPTSTSSASFRAANVEQQPVLGRHDAAARQARARRDARPCDAKLVRRPAGRKEARSARARPRTGQGLRHVHDPRQAAVLAADQLHGSSATGAGRSSRWSCC